MLQQKKINDSPKTLKELAGFYQVSTRTFKKWLARKSLQHIERVGNFYSIADINKIVDHLGSPDTD